MSVYTGVRRGVIHHIKSSLWATITDYCVKTVFNQVSFFSFVHVWEAGTQCTVTPDKWHLRKTLTYLLTVLHVGAKQKYTYISC